LDTELFSIHPVGLRDHAAIGSGVALHHFQSKGKSAARPPGYGRVIAVGRNAALMAGQAGLPTT
jgi:hypothetical protein